MDAKRKKNEGDRYIAKAIQLLGCAIQSLEKINTTGAKAKAEQGHPKKYKWTADISNLVELAYAIIEAECLNNGQARIMEFTEFLGKTFNVKIERCSDFYYKMKTKSGSRTAFLHKLIKVLEARMDRDEEKSLST